MGAAVAWAPEPADLFAACHARFEQVLQVAGSQETQRMKHSDLERLLATEGQELMRQLYQDCLDQQAQAEVSDEVVDAQGKQRTRQRTQRRELETIFGTVEVERTGYGAEGEASLHPLDAQLNLPDERYSLEVRRRVALEASKNSFDEAVETLSRYTGAEIGKRQVEELVGRAAQDFDAFYEQRHHQAAAAEATAAQATATEATATEAAATEAAASEATATEAAAAQATAAQATAAQATAAQATAAQATAAQATAAEAAATEAAAAPPAATDAVPTDGLLVITGDAKGVVMHREDLRPATRTASERTPRSKLNTRLSKGEKRNRKRMAMQRFSVNESGIDAGQVISERVNEGLSCKSLQYRELQN